MNQKAKVDAAALLRLIRSLEPVITEKYGLMIPYGYIYDNAEQRSLFPNTNIIDGLLVKLEEAGTLKIIYDANKMILGICLK